MSGVRTLRLILDQGVPRDSGALLRERGHDCTHVDEVGMAMTSDKEILVWSLEQNGILVTLDADFHAILAVSGQQVPLSFGFGGRV